MKRVKKDFKLVTDTLMVDYNLLANEGSEAESIIEEIFEVYLQDYLKDLTRKSSGRLLKSIVTNILANLLNAESQGYSSLIYPMGKKNFQASRYLPKFITERLVVRAVQILVDAKVVIQDVGTKKMIQIRSTFGGSDTSLVQQAASLRFTEDISYGDLEWGRFSVRPETEVIILKSKRKTPSSSSELVNYTDTTNMGKEIKESIRPFVRKINDYLLSHTIEYSGDHLCDRSSTSYHRIFNQGTIKRGGRYFGHWAQNIPARERHLIHIDGQKVMDLDYQTMYYNLLLYRDGATEAPQEDPFLIPGYEEFRGTFKALAYALLNSSSLLKNSPEGLMPPGCKLSYSTLKTILILHLPILKKYLKSEIGMELMNLESRIIGRAVMNMMDRDNGFVILHDGLLVAQNSKHPEGCMHEAFSHIIGWDSKVTKEMH